MDKDRTESFESPLDKVFDDLPQENPPTDLQQRCLAALDEIDAERGIWSAPWWYAPLRNVVATAAVLVLAVGLFTLLPLFMSAKKGPSTIVARLSREKPVQTAAGRPLAPSGQPVSKLATGPGMAGPPPPPPDEDVIARLEASVDEASARRIGGTFSLDEEEQAGYTQAYGDNFAMRERLGVDQAEAKGERAGGGKAFYDGQTKWAGRPPAVVVTHGSVEQALSEGRPPQASEVEAPWRDLSGERQVAVDKQLELEVKDVEKSYDEARSIVEKHGGFVASDEISIDARALDTAVLTIRLPKDSTVRRRS